MIEMEEVIMFVNVTYELSRLKGTLNMLNFWGYIEF